MLLILTEVCNSFLWCQSSHLPTWQQHLLLYTREPIPCSHDRISGRATGVFTWTRPHKPKCGYVIERKGGHFIFKRESSHPGNIFPFLCFCPSSPAAVLSSRCFSPAVSHRLRKTVTSANCQKQILTSHYHFPANSCLVQWISFSQRLLSDLTLNVSPRFSVWSSFFFMTFSVWLPAPSPFICAGTLSKGRHGRENHHIRTQVCDFFLCVSQRFPASKTFTHYSICLLFTCVLQVPERPEGGDVSPWHKRQTGERVGQQRVPLQTGGKCLFHPCVAPCFWCWLATWPHFTLAHTPLAISAASYSQWL